MSILFTVIGCGDAFFSGGNGHSSFYIRSKTMGIMLDCGATALYGLKKQGLSSADIDVIILTHFHGDHFAGLPFLLLDAVRLSRGKPLVIMSPGGCKKRLDTAMRLFFPGTQVLKKLDIEYVEFCGRQEAKYKELTIESFPVVHTKETLPHGVRIKLDDTTISFTGDTGWTDTIIEIVQNADLAVCECTFYSTHFKGHISYKELREHVPRFNCKKLLLTHFDEEMLQHAGETLFQCAFDGLQLYL